MSKQDVIDRAKAKAKKHLTLMGCGIEKEKNAKVYLEYMTYIKQLENQNELKESRK
ncbi:MAG: hypothetical protein HOM11_02235 [Methylococcales bacterium]|nr:hypothetical protein [Methylococcales bacterium]MBT7444823.1 hypothetical protein [Methylococcales bacterium]